MRWIFNPDVIRRKREMLGLSPTAFARRLKAPMSGTQIIDIETGRRSLTVETLLRLCNEYDLSPAAFFQCTQETPTDTAKMPLIARSSSGSS